MINITTFLEREKERLISDTLLDKQVQKFLEAPFPRAQVLPFT